MDIQLDISLKPHIVNTLPEISYGINNTVIDIFSLSGPIKLRVESPVLPGDNKFWLTFNNKNYNESLLDQGKDMAVEIAAVTIEGMTLDRFRWAGMYYPDYPDWTIDGDQVIKSATYLGWNGRWELPFTAPIFTWIHRLEHLGWLYEP